jgi:hypothetical protein
MWAGVTLTRAVADLTKKLVPATALGVLLPDRRCIEGMNFEGDNSRALLGVKHDGGEKACTLVR